MRHSMLRLLVLAMLLGLWPAAGGAVTYTLTPEADAYVDQNLPDSNYGLGQWLYIGRYDGDKFRRTFLRFDLSGIPAGEQITRATLTLFTQAGPAAPFTIDVRRVAADSWLESGSGAITWNNQPVSGNTLDNQAVSGGYSVLVTWDLLAQPSQWDWQADLSDNLLSLVLRMPAEESMTLRAVAFRSKESGSYLPELRITTSPVPIPPTLLLLGSGLLGSGLLGRRRKSLR